MALPDFQALMLPVLRAAESGETRISDARDRLEIELKLSEDEKNERLPSGTQTTFANRVHWAKFYLSKAGLVEQTKRGHFQITSRGRDVLKSKPDMIDIRFLAQFPEFAEFRAREPDQSSGAHEEVSGNRTLTPDETIRSAHAGIEDALAEDLLMRIRSKEPAFFERVVVRLLVAMGYGGSNVDVDKALVGGTGDGGVDGVINQDLLGLDRIYVQAKRYAEGSNVGAGDIRDFFGSLDRFKATKGLFVTTASFSQKARETAEMLSKRIVLIDGPQLARLMIRHDVGCKPEEVITIKRVDEEFFE